MRSFLILFTVVSVAYGKPQGYNYGAGLSGSSGLLSGHGLSGNSDLSGGFLSAPSHTHSVSAFGGLGGGAQLNGGLVGLEGGLGSSGLFSSSGLGSSGSIGFGGLASNTHHHHHQEPLVHKQFITVSAPEDHEHLEQSKHLVIGRPQKNYRVVFIKAPSSSNANVKLTAEYAPQEEKTVIYVLSKKDNTLEVNDIATPAPTVPEKPEVFFIKYKTEEEAQHAQHQIQAEYDKIQGTSEHTDAGIAPQHSVVGILDGHIAGAGNAPQHSIVNVDGAAGSVPQHSVVGLLDGNIAAAGNAPQHAVLNVAGAGSAPQHSVLNVAGAGSAPQHSIVNVDVAGSAPQHSVVGLVDGNIAAAGSSLGDTSSLSGSVAHHAVEGSDAHHAAASTISTHGVGSEGSSTQVSGTYLPPAVDKK